MYTLYGAEVSYFTGKVRAYLRWRGAGFQEQKATQSVYRDLILPGIGWPVIPVLTFPDGTLVQDSAEIISAIEAREDRHPPVCPQTPLQAFVTCLLHLYADEWLTIPAMHYRWSYDEDWAYREFGALSRPDASPEEQYMAGRRNGAAFKGALPVLGIHTDTIPCIEASYLGFLADFSVHLERYRFLLGERPSLADFAFYGPLYAHLYRDPHAGALMRRTAPRVAAWVESLSMSSDGSGDLLAQDEVPASLEPILRRQADEQFPALLETIRLFAHWSSGASPGTHVPRGLGEILIRIGTCSGTAQARSFPLFRLQAVLDAYDGMGPADRGRADALMRRIWPGSLSQLRLPCRLVRKDFRLAV